MEPKEPNQESTSKNIEPVQESKGLSRRNELDELFFLVTGDIEISVGKEELLRTRKIANKIVRLQPQRLRMCSTDCPMRDSCRYITSQEQENWPDVRGARCPIEADLWAMGFSNYVDFVYSMDPERSDPTDYELSICRDIAWIMVEEHRILISSALKPEPIIESVVPGTEGMTAEQVNPRLDAMSIARKDLGKAIDRLTKAVERRLKNVHEQKEIFVKTVSAVKEEMISNPEKYEGTRLGGLLEVMTERVDLNEEEKAREEEKNSGS